ncbi:DNA-3-methyladenine glycosylase family protein [Labedaea rhizosphaerae]|uniref:DNA-3-methyladenine glycosylase II n=1 Tax=Labedaea rhizosphaerae TaxID=598644 RepID=A0A4R6SRK2_LABRH|nr:DNA-3-methyladenine glycosylase 2 family protein [Labedaea rhizosphaerae]TDQ05923.1 DNA-3-methyladenine glycosylase II [Labedaea rhizosphaerae]
MTTFTIDPRGPFSLYEQGVFGFGQNFDTRWDGVMRLAFCVDGYSAHAGVEVRQDGELLHCEMTGDADPAVVRRQVARVISADHDGHGFAAIGEQDPVIGALQRVRPGLRPPQFYSPYEAAVWSVLSARRPARQMAAVRDALSRAHGTVFTLAGRECPALPAPAQLLRVTEFPGIPELKLRRLHEVAKAALDGQLAIDRLTAMDPDDAMRDLQRLPGIGPFYSALVVIRACGLTDVLPTQEPKALDLVRRLYDLPATPSPQQLAVLAEPWRPYRTWATVLVRAAGARLLESRAAA